MADLTQALALNGPDATLTLYREWAASYDSGFARDMQYRLPAHVAGAFVAAGGAGPVLDVGAGTGLLARAAEKGVYRALVQADVTRALPLERVYQGVTSSGTFTAGHVGPEAFGPMLAVALPGALFALSVNQRVFTVQGFDAALQGLQSAGAIRDLQLIEVEVYGAAAQALDPDHAGDRAWVVLFRAA